MNKKDIETALSKLPQGRSREEVNARLEVELDLYKEMAKQRHSAQEIVELTGWSPVKTYMLQFRAEATPVEPTPDNVVRLRNEEQRPWGYIAAATGLSESRVRKIYTEHTGVPYNESKALRRPVVSTDKIDQKDKEETPTPRKRKPRKSKSE